MTPDGSRDAPDPEGASPEGRSTGQVLESFAKATFVVLVVLFGGAYIRAHWHGLSEATHGAHAGWIVGAAVFGIAGQVASMLAFSALLQAESTDHIPVAESASAFYVTQLGKYIPGSVWAVVAMANAVRRLGLTRRAGVRAVVLSLAFSSALGVLLGGSLVLFGVVPRGWWVLPVASLVLLMAAAMRPDIAVDLVRPLAHKMLPPHLTHHLLRAAVAWPLATWLFFGLHCWCLVVALGGPVAPSLVPAIGGFALAYVAGVVVVIAPSGIGVRETVLALILVGTLGSAFDHDKSVVLVVASRVTLALIDFALAGVILPIVYLARRSSAPSAT